MQIACTALHAVQKSLTVASLAWHTLQSFPDHPIRLRTSDIRSKVKKDLLYVVLTTRLSKLLAMPKHGWLTPKAIGNRIKAKGLQKLRWYCQMCQKQCRDEVGGKGDTIGLFHLIRVHPLQMTRFTRPP